MDLVLLQSWFRGLLPFMGVFVLLMLMDFISGVVYAWYDKYFQWEMAPKFLKTGAVWLMTWLFAEILAFVPVLLKIEIPNYADSILDVAPKAVYAAIVCGKYVGSIVTNIKAALELKNDDPWAEREPIDPPAAG